MAQRTIFDQVIKLIPRTQFEAWVNKHDSDKYLRKMNTWTWFCALLFGQLTGHDSIRALERVFCNSNKYLMRLGFGEIRRSTLADANRTRSLGILEDVYGYLLEKAKTLAPNNPGLRVKSKIFAMDSTTINLCLNLCPWATFHHGKGAFKLHTAIDLAGNLPEFVVMTSGRVHDVRVARQSKLSEGATYVFDKAYIDYSWLNSLNEEGVYFVSRAKENCQHWVYKSNKVDRTRGHMCDQRIRLKTHRGQDYKGTLRRISYRDPDTKKKLVFLTNRFDLATQTICDLYKARWRIENFFKTMKQNLKIKKYLGTSENAVKAQVLTAIIAYLLIQLIRLGHRVTISISDTMAVIGVMLLLRAQMKVILGSLPCTTRYPPDRQLCLDF